MFFLTRLLVRLLFVKGKLMGIPTIHFARWVLLDRDRMLFYSNFDGSWTQYLGDFIDKSGWGLNAVFGNTRVFPRIWFLFLRGAYDEMHFLGWSRSTQIPTQVWYASELDQSIQNINANTAVFQQAISLHHCRDADVLLFTAFADRRDSVARPQRAMLDEFCDPKRHLLVKVNFRLQLSRSV